MANLVELNNLTAENMVINAIFSKPQNFHKVSSMLRPDDFYRTSNRLIYRAMAEMILAGETLNMATLVEKLRHDGTLEKAGGIKGIAFQGLAGGIGNIEEQAEIVAEYARRRAVIEKARELEALAGDFTSDIDKAAMEISLELSGMTAEARATTKSAKEAVMDLASLIDKRMDRQQEILSTGLADIDKLIIGFEAGQLIVIAGRPGHGKSAMAGTIAVNVAQKGKRVLMFSMEMSGEELAGRFVSRLGGLSGEKIKKPGEMTDEDWDKYVIGMEKAGKLPITINSQGALTPADVASEVSKTKNKDGLDLVVIDYLQLMGGGRKSDNRVQEISYITRTLKNLAVSLKVPIILLSQLSRSNEKERRAPQLTDLRDSGSIEQDANTILLIQRESHISEDMKTVELGNKTSVNIAKQRDGQCGTVLVTFIPSRGYFVNYIEENRYEAR